MRRKIKKLLVCSVICFIIGYNTANLNIFDFWCINTALSGIIYIFLGYCLQNQLNMNNKVNLIQVISSVLIYLLVCYIGCLTVPKAIFDFHNIGFGNFPINVLMILLGIICSFTVSSYACKKYKMKLLSIIGQNTLVIYLLSPYLSKIILKVAKILVVQNENLNLLMVSFVSLTVCVIGSIISEICYCFFTWSVGRKKHN